MLLSICALSFCLCFYISKIRRSRIYRTSGGVKDTKNAFLRPFTMSVKESNFNEKNHNFHICLRSGPRWLALFDMPNLNQFDILSISIFCKIALSISISIFSKITISISISIFLELPYRYRYRYRYFSELSYRYRYFSKVLIYRQSICHIDISNRASE